jgi:hypothetical protein
MEALTRLAAYAVSLAAGFGTLIVFRKEPSLFRTGLACAVVVFTAGVIAMTQQNMVGVALVLAPPFIMVVVTSLLPREAPSLEVDYDADEPRDVQLDPGPARLRVGQAHRLLGLARYAIAVLVLAFAAQAVAHGTMPHGAGDRMRELATHRTLPYRAVVDLPDRIVFLAGAKSDRGREQDDEADGAIDDTLRSSVEVADRTPDLDLEPVRASECLLPSGAAAKEAACDAVEAER